MFGAEETVFDAFGPIHSTWATVLHFHTLPFGVYLFALAPLTAEVVAARIEAEPARAQQRLFEVLVGKEGDERGELNLLPQDIGSRGEGRGDTRRKAAATAAAARESGVSSRSETKRKGNEAKVASEWQAEEKDEEEEDDSPLQSEEESAEGELGDNPRDIEKEALLFSQIFQALDLNPQDVQLWANALKRHLGDLLTEAEVLHRKLRFSLLNRAASGFSTEQLSSSN
ncbi:hypothetical protein Emed_006405 [Eimeria media]